MPSSKPGTLINVIQVTLARKGSRDDSAPPPLVASCAINYTATNKGGEGCIDSQTGMLSGIPESARCVQRFDDSRNSAIHITYRISLRSSSLREPRDPLSKVVFDYVPSMQTHKQCNKSQKD